MGGEYLDVSGTVDSSVVRMVIGLGDWLVVEYLDVSGTVDSSVVRMVIGLAN